MHGELRPGRPPVFTALQTAQVEALACRMPAETGTPLSRDTHPNVAATFPPLIADLGDSRYPFALELMLHAVAALRPLPADEKHVGRPPPSCDDAPAYPAEDLCSFSCVWGAEPG
ncbi:hypothetical protein AB0D83_01795 [Streptomyces decoyicus]|uniref:hypothetical protein n=1 Tax=Streptomyces decoyicus TaxID=249567 RepID=UPI0033CC80F5